MKSSMKILSILSFAALTTTGCYTEEPDIIRESAGATTTKTVVRETVVVKTPAPIALAPVTLAPPPPAPPVEALGVPPSGGHGWVPGHWTREDDRWVWMSGRYEMRPAPTSVYVPGHWDNQGTGYIWREGYWQ